MHAKSIASYGGSLQLWSGKPSPESALQLPTFMTVSSAMLLASSGGHWLLLATLIQLPTRLHAVDSCAWSCRYRTAARVPKLDGIEAFFRCVHALEPRSTYHDDVVISMYLQDVHGADIYRLGGTPYEVAHKTFPEVHETTAEIPNRRHRVALWGEIKRGISTAQRVIEEIAADTAAREPQDVGLAEQDRPPKGKARQHGMHLPAREIGG